MPKPTVYLETTIPSLLTARPSKDARLAGMQASVRTWWATQRNHFELFASPLVLAEAQVGDAEMAAARLRCLSEARLLAITDDALVLAEKLMRKMSLPAAKRNDAVHIAVAATANITHLLTWNCKHIANVDIIMKVEALCEQAGYRCPTICTTDELNIE